MVEIETPRLLLRRMTSGDTDALHKITGNAEVMRFVGNNKPISWEETARLIEKSMNHYAQYGCGVFGVIHRNSGEFVGYCGFTFKPHGMDSLVPEILYGFTKAYWGQGIASEAASAALQYGFRTQGFRRIIATVDPNNAASIRIIRKLGMSWVENRLDEHGLPEALYQVIFAADHGQI